MLLANRTARRLNVNSEALWNAVLVAILAAFVASRLAMVVLHWDDFIHFPVLVLAASTLTTRAGYIAGTLCGLAAGFSYMLLKHMPMLRTLDALAPALALAEGITSLGAFAAGSAYGRPTSAPWAVTFHAKYATLWAGTPLNVALHPTQLYACAASLGICGLLLWMLQGSPQPGEILGGWLFLEGVSSFVVDLYHADAVRTALFNTALSMTQGIALLMILGGGALWLNGSKESNKISAVPLAI